MSLPRIALRPRAPDPAQKSYLLYFVPGNPGLVAYYAGFLQQVHDRLCATPLSASPADASPTRRPNYYIYAQSLAGFGDEDSTSGPSPRDTPYSLPEQIALAHASIARQAARGPDAAHPATDPFDGVLVLGHSVGAFMTLEIMQRVQQQRRERDVADTRSPPAPRITAGILLFPTVTHIGASRSGRVLDAVARGAGAAGASWAAALGRAAVTWMPAGWLRGAVGWVTGMPAEMAAVTSGFLGSRMGIWQALHMGRDELNMITEDRWDSDIWGVEHEDAAAKVPKLVFYFAKEVRFSLVPLLIVQDPWVANHTRDALIAARAGIQDDAASDAWSSSRPVMMIDKEGVPHAFSLRHADFMADKVTRWVSGICEPE